MKNSADAFLSAVHSELARARAKFPKQDSLTTLAGLTEEVGELAEAILDYSIIDVKYRKGKTFTDIQKEAVQVAVMAARIVLDCGL